MPLRVHTHILNNEQGLQKIVNGLTLSKNEMNKRMKNVQKELNANINNLRKSYDSRNPRTSSAVEKLRISSNSNNAHLEPLTSKSSAFPNGVFEISNQMNAEIKHRRKSSHGGKQVFHNQIL